MNLTTRYAVFACLLLFAAGCHRGPALLPAPAIAADTARAEQLAAGLVHRYYYVAKGPWAIHVLDVDRARCWMPVPLAADTASAHARVRTSEIFARATGYVAAVNADFFALANGLPLSALVHDGAVVAGPTARPVFAVDSAGIPWIGHLHVESGTLRLHGDLLPITDWNRQAARGIALFTDRWGASTDTASGAIEVAVSRTTEGVLAEPADTSPAGSWLAPRRVVLVAGAQTNSAVRARLRITSSEAAAIDTPSFSPIRPYEAVGGFPILVRHDSVTGAIDSANDEKFRARNPRTAIGIADGGRRLFMVTVDGRQMPYSDGMSLRELAEFMRSLGATEALNLDGGGSTTMVVADGRKARIVNRPSEKDGERAVANALALRHQCGLPQRPAQ